MKVYSNLFVINESVTIIMNDGSSNIVSPCSFEKLQVIKAAETEEELYELILNKEFKEEKEQIKQEYENKKLIIDKLHLLEDTGDFEIKNNKVYLLGINRALPEFMVKKFLQILEKGISTYLNPFPSLDNTEYEAFKRFTLWCIAAPHPQVLDKLFPFLEQYGLKLTKEGYFIAIRNVVTVPGTDNKLADFVTKQWVKMKFNRKSPKNYFVYQDENQDFIKRKEKYREEYMIAEILGNLNELYNNLPRNEDVKYTDNWTKTFDIRINKWVKTDPSKIKWNTEDCTDTGSLHFSLDSTGLCGDKSMLIAINPMHVTGVGGYKATSWAYLPFMATEVEEAREMLLNQDFNSFELSFEQFEEGINGDLEETIKKGYVDAIHRDEFKIPEISNNDINILVHNLVKIKDELDLRVVDVN